ncbi:GNAT family N-acetyltransferase [Longimicrobium terrae]|uniref:RimJ/RimL family protein N-acetyltransferase n=1 Tax=Longimicrobium terrae TaxID=1639882 RepID=A0A841GKX0_9BACT|nr:GNAT family protein [Longimicrobium terrae]MBB4634997.1 RimJ/RimL family protein N-acetyltransferase [Longimicrobium terrae]MBB6069391.1 RimJ/RimL family protein N-acetyltransferase [Longimicrobium terrae]NNC31803.1 GNAT family N-acetyltransferase [Longimicrobium terrae]
MAIHLDLGVCIVRAWRESDAESLALHANDRRVWLNLRDRFPHPYSRADAESYLGAVCGQQPATSFAIEVDGDAAGGISYVPHDDVERISAEIGYWLGAPFWGRGLMTTVVAAFSRALFDADPQLRRLFAVPFDWNGASSRVLEKAGYRLEGRMRQSAIKDGVVVDQLLHALLREEVAAS